MANWAVHHLLQLKQHSKHQQEKIDFFFLNESAANFAADPSFASHSGTSIFSKYKCVDFGTFQTLIINVLYYYSIATTLQVFVYARQQFIPLVK